VLTFVVKSAASINASDVTLGLSRLIPRTASVRPNRTLEGLLDVYIVVRNGVWLDHKGPVCYKIVSTVVLLDPQPSSNTSVMVD
jgi:hypothetical protein